MDDLLSLAGPAQNEELIPIKHVCNFSSITEQTHDQFSLEVVWWTNVVCLPLIAMLGLACNSLNILILTGNRAARRIPSWTLLLALAVCDCLFLLFAVLEVTPMSIPALAFSNQFNLIYSHCALYIRTLASTFYKSSVLIVVAFNVERYICVVYPLRAHRVCTGRTSRTAVVASIFISFLCSVQWPLCYRVRLCYQQAVDEHFYVILLTENAALQLYYRFMDYFTLFAFNVLPILALLVMNTRIILALGRVVDEDERRAGKGGESGGLVQDVSSTGPQSKAGANAMLFAVVLMLLVCVGPQAPARLLFDLYGQYHSTAIVYTSITQQLVFLNAAMNFAVYCVVSKRYRGLMRGTVKRLVSGLRAPGGWSAGSRGSRGSSAPATTLDDRPLVLIQV